MPLLLQLLWVDHLLQQRKRRCCRAAALPAGHAALQHQRQLLLGRALPWLPGVPAAANKASASSRRGLAALVLQQQQHGRHCA
jgi:hypothetical protein